MRILLLAALASTGCFSSWSTKNLLRVSCDEGRGDDCFQSGEAWMRKASWAFADFKEAEYVVDKEAARRDYARGCQLNSVRACAALIERHLVEGGEETSMRAKLAALGVEPRSDEQVESKDALVQKVCETDAATRKAARDAGFAKQMQALAGLLVQASNEMGKTLATGKPSAGLVYSDDPETMAKLQQLQQLRDVQPGQAPGDAEIAAMKKNIRASVADYDARIAKQKSAQVQQATPRMPQPQTRPAPARVAAGPTQAQLAAASAQKKLKECLARPAPQMRTAQTNPFQAYLTGYQSLLREAGKCPEAPGAAWKECIGMNARIWPDTEAQQDETDFNKRVYAVMSFMPPGPSSCLYNQTLHSTRAFCISMPKSACLTRLEQNIADMQCANTILPRVWAGEVARNDASAKEKQDDDCRNRFH